MAGTRGQKTTLLVSLPVLVLGFLVGRWSASMHEQGVESPVEPAAASQFASGAPERTRLPDIAREEVPDERSCESTISEQQRHIRLLEEALYGIPLEWSDDVPQEDRDEWFLKGLGGAIAASGTSQELILFDCSEPPCIVALERFPEIDASATNPESTDEWRDAFGEGGFFIGGGFECPGAYIAHFNILTTDSAEGAQSDHDNLRKRLEIRTDDLREGMREAICTRTEGD